MSILYENNEFQARSSVGHISEPIIELHHNILMILSILLNKWREKTAIKALEAWKWFFNGQTLA